MNEQLQNRTARLREYFGLESGAALLAPDLEPPRLTPEQERHLARFNLEWHVVPSADAVPLDDAYFERLYPTRPPDFAQQDMYKPDYTEILRAGHRKIQGCIVAVETTRKPRYLPGNRQYYGTCYGFDASADPLAPYMGRAHFHTGTRYDHIYASLYELIKLVNADWSERGLMPSGYYLTLCPPALWNLAGNLFYPEWSETETLEMSFYRDAHGNAICYALGSNQPGDFSYIRTLEAGASWALLGFRTALLPGDTREP